MDKIDPTKTAANGESNATAHSEPEPESKLDTELFIRSLRGKDKDVPLTELLKEIQRNEKEG
jgi:hypothetical protein